MSKRKKTYLDKINFDVFEDDKPEDFDLFANISVDKEEIDIEATKPAKEPVEESDDELDEEPDEESDDELDEEPVEESDNEHDKEPDNEHDKEPEEEQTKHAEYSSGKKKKGGIAVFIIFWIILFGAVVFAFLYFETDVFKKKKDITTNSSETTLTEEQTTADFTEATEEAADDNFYTVYSYQTNADININALMADYYDALVRGDSEKLKEIVTEPDAFGDMMIYETKAQVISEYSNITCYTIPGLNEGEILVFTTSNITITGVKSKPLDIKQFYVVKDGNNYKINNGVLSKDVIDYINVQAGSSDIQALYKSVQDNINECLANDETFADFYNKISTNTDSSGE